MGPVDKVMLVLLLLGLGYIAFYIYAVVSGIMEGLSKVAKKTKVLPPKPLNDCGGKEMDAGLCYEKCRPGHKGGGPMCHVDIYGVGIGRIPPG